MSKFSRALVHFCFIYTCIEGFVVNVTYPNPLAYIIKDIALLFIYLGLVTEQRPGIGSLAKLGGAILAVSVMQFFFLAMPTPVSALSAAVAIKQRLFYIPLIYVGYFYTRTEQDAFALVKLMAWTAVPTALFGIYLFFAGPGALRSMGAGYSAVFYSTAGAAGIAFWRVPGTFTSPGQFSVYLLIQACLLTGYVLVPRIGKRNKIVGSFALALSLGAMLTSGSRAPIVLYVFCTGVSLFYMGKLTKAGTAAVGLYGVMTVAFTYFGAGVADRVGSILSEENFSRVQTTSFGQLFWYRIFETPLGLGLGVATIGARHFTEWNKVHLVESYFGIIVTETGIFGLAVFIWFFLKVAFSLVAIRFTVARASWNALWYLMTMLVLVIIAVMPSSTGIDSAPGNMYFYFFIGMAFRLSDMERVRLRALGRAA